MMVMWSEYDGSDDAGGEGVTAYMEDEFVWKPSPHLDGGRERVERVPPPEVLKGDAALMRQAIRAVPFQCRYSSGVLSFDLDDVDVTAFNAGDSELRRQVAEAIQAFEDTAYAGIPQEHRPPTFWTTHTHTGRLELNFCMPRAILAGSGKLRSINPHPPGRESRQLYDAFRDVFNARYGWADPEDPARARLVKVPNWIQKIVAEARRAGVEPKQRTVERIGEWAEAAVAAGEIRSRDDLIGQIRAAGIQVVRAGEDYITLVNETGVRVRLRGRLFSAVFTSPETLRPVAKTTPRLDLAECQARLARHQKRRAEFNLRRYGGPAWAPPKPLRTPMWRDHGGDHHEAGANACHIHCTAGRPRYQVRLWMLIFGGTLPEELLMALRWVDRSSRTVRLTDGSAVTDHGERISANRPTTLAVKLMIAEAQAKGWTAITINGSAEFQRLAIAEALRAGLAVSNPEFQQLVAREVAMTKEDAHERSDTNGAGVAAVSQPDSARGRGAREAADRTDRQLDDGSAAIGASVRRLAASARNGVTRRLQSRQAEIDRFKTEVDLCALATTLGFAEDRKAGDRNHRVMRHQDGSKLIIGASKAGHWVFSSNTGATGTVLDLLRWRAGLDIRGACKRLREWLGEPGGRPKVDGVLYTPRPKPTPAPIDTMKAVSEWKAANETTRSVFLERSRGIDPTTLANERFAGTFRVDERQNALFPYRDGQGAIIGTERRNRPPAGTDRSFKTYTAGAVPGIWTSNTSETDSRLVIVESPIDAMSHWQLSSAEDQAVTRYAAIRNGFRDDDLEALIEAMPAEAVIIGACDPDAAGDGYTAKIQAAAMRVGRAYRDERPEGGDWNDMLRNRSTSPRPRPDAARP